jgi:hypothetical protein
MAFRAPIVIVTRAWLWVQYVLYWCVFPLAPALRSTDSAAFAPADASAVGFLRFVRRLHSYYDERQRHNNPRAEDYFAFALAAGGQAETHALIS